MDEEPPTPSTSKQNQEKQPRKSRNTNSNSDLEMQDDQSSENSMSYSENSNDEGHKRPTAPTGPKKRGGKKRRKTRKSKERKNRGRPSGRVDKRSRRTEAKRPARRSKRLQEKKRRERALSVSTIFSHSSSDVSVPRACPRCGHRCCGRRSYEMRKRRTRRMRNIKRTEKSHSKCSESNQAGSRCLMLSPLCLNTNASPEPEPVPEQPMSSGITPEMIYEALRSLTMWRQYVHTAAILDYIKRIYPVGFDEGLLAELKEKLRIAVFVGIVIQSQTKEDLWCLNSEELMITNNHVTLFWKIYGDTMKPVVRKPHSQEKTEQDQQSNTVSREKHVKPNLKYHYDYI